MLKKATVIATLAMTTMAASAQEENRARTYEELAPVVVKYAEALGCGGDGELDALDAKRISLASTCMDVVMKDHLRTWQR